MKLLLFNILFFISISYVSCTRHSIKTKIKNHQAPSETEEDKAYLERKKKKELIYDINKSFTPGQVKHNEIKKMFE